MSTFKLDNIVWRAGEAAANSQYSVTADKVVWGTSKSWINHNGGGSSTRSSFNMSSVTKNSTGNYTFTLTNALPDANFCAVTSYSPDQAGSSAAAAIGQGGLCVNWVGTALVAPTSSTIRISHNWSTSGYPDPTYLCVNISR